jgi:hypothetical protein
MLPLLSASIHASKFAYFENNALQGRIFTTNLGGIAATEAKVFDVSLKFSVRRTSRLVDVACGGQS